MPQNYHKIFVKVYICCSVRKLFMYSYLSDNVLTAVEVANVTRTSGLSRAFKICQRVENKSAKMYA